MKKLAVAAAVLTALTTTAAFANVTVDVYSDRTTNKDFYSSDEAKQGIVLGYSPIANLDLEVEATTNKDLDFGAAYKFEIGQNFFVKPQLGYVAKFEDGYKGTNKWETLDPIYGRYNALELNIPNANVIKVGVELGGSFGDVFTSIRYRVEMDTAANKLTATGPKASDDLISETSRVGRTDVMVGYNFDAVTLTAKGIHKSQLNKDIRDINSALNQFDQVADLTQFDIDKLGTDNSSWTSEIKATLTSYDGVAPYVQYAHNHASKDQQIKLGAKFSF